MGPSVLIIGSGPAGLVNARTLLDDGFDVTIVSKEASPGGEWAVTYPELATNSPWGSFTFSGLAMPLPASCDGKTVPARTYRRYLEDFFHHFVEGRAKFRFETEVMSLEPRKGARGWIARLQAEGREVEEVTCDRVVLAVGGLGRPSVPDVLSSSPVSVIHSSALSRCAELDQVLSRVPSSLDNPHLNGDDETVLVIGGGKSGMDAAAMLARRGRKAVIAFRELKWFSPTVPPGMLGANRLDILMGPSRVIDSWTMWLYHCTSLGARWVKSFWTVMRGGWSTLYDEKLPAPSTDPFVALPHFAGGFPLEPTDFKPLVTAGRIATLPQANLLSVDKEQVTFATQGGTIRVRCGAIIAATGYRDGGYGFLEKSLRKQLGLDSLPPAPGWEDRVRAVRSRWTTVVADGEEKGFAQPLVFRGILPVGRWKERDLAVTGGTRPLYIPAIAYEVESHWISSLFNDDPFLRLPRSEEELLKEVHADNEYNLARYPGIDAYASIPAGTYFTGFNDLAYSRVLLRDMQLDPWRQKSRCWWKPLDWLDVRVHAEQYASLGRERRERG